MATPKDEAASLLKLAIQQMDEGNESEAIDTVTQALDLNPDYAEALELRGNLYYNADQPEQAYADLTRAVQLNPKLVVARHLRGVVAANLGENDQALKDLNEALRLDGNFRPAYISRAMLYMQRGDRTRAIDDLTRALRLRPSVFAYNKRAACHYFGKNYAQAIADHQSALHLEPENHGTCNYLAWILCTCPVASLREGKRAVKLARQACEATDWKFPGYIDTLGAAYAEVENFDEAIRYAKKVIDLSEPEDREKYEERLELYRAGKKYHTA